MNIIFDMGKVLLDYDTRLACYRHAKDREKAEILYRAIFADPSWFELVDGGKLSEAEYWELAKTRLNTQELRELADRIAADWWLDSLFPVRGMYQLISELLEEKVPIYILSNCGRCFHDFSYKIPHYEHFSGVVVSAEEGLVKPDPAIFRLICDRYGLAMGDCLFIDDLQRNVDGAIRAGMQGYCFADGDVNRLRETLRRICHENQ